MTQILRPPARLQLTPRIPTLPTNDRACITLACDNDGQPVIFAGPTGPAVAVLVWPSDGAGEALPDRTDAVTAARWDISARAWARLEWLTGLGLDIAAVDWILAPSDAGLMPRPTWISAREVCRVDWRAILDRAVAGLAADLTPLNAAPNRPD